MDINEKKKNILEFINSKEYTSMNLKEIMYVLNIPNDKKDDIYNILNELEEEGKVIKTKKNKYISLSSQGLVCGKYIAKEKGFGFIEISENDDDLYVSKENTFNAMNNDIVLARIIEEKKEDKRAEAQIVKIIYRANNRIIGRYENSKNFGFVVPDDNRITKDIFIPKKYINNARNGDKVIVEIIKWAEDDKKSEGKVVEILGKANDPKLDFVSVINMFNIDSEFTDEVLNEAKNINQFIDQNEIFKRKDFRNDMIITIDSHDTKDIDDAISLKKIDGNLFELGVHIADVSYYVRENTKINETAINRGTSVYLINKVIPMLPKELSNGICSLNEGEDRFALSVIMKIDKTGKVIDSNIYKSVINSNKKCTYKDLNDILNKEENAKYDEYSKYMDMIYDMNELRKILENKRYKRGSIEFDLYESNLELDENDVCIKVDKRERGISENIIEEFMLVANETIAEMFFHLEAPFIYRVHDLPDEEKIFTLSKILNNLNIKVKGLAGEDIYPKTMQKILDEVKDKENGKMIANLVLRSMQLARYSEENAGHFGLASKYYCHFTSPIRRYPDLFIHRVISRYIENGYNLSEKEILKFEKQAKDYSIISSDMERNAEKAEREFDEIKKCEYMEQHIDEEYEGTISSLTTFGMFVELDNTIEGLVRYDNMTDDYYDFQEANMCIIGRRNHKKYIVGDKVRIKVINASKIQKRIDFELV